MHAVSVPAGATAGSIFCSACAARTWVPPASTTQPVGHTSRARDSVSRHRRTSGRSDGEAPALAAAARPGSASSIHAGIGQLHLYSRLTPGLIDHDLVLLVPKLPEPAVVEASQAAGIKGHSYSFGDLETGGDIIFSDAFLDLCLGTGAA
jgi:hypothetical protein